MSFLAVSFLMFALTLGAIFTYFAIKSRDLLRAVVFSAAQSAAYAIALFMLMAPDIVLAYIAVAIGIYTVVLLYIISKTERYEEVE